LMRWGGGDQFFGKPVNMKDTTPSGLCKYGSVAEYTMKSIPNH